MTNGLSSRVLFNKWQTQLVECIDNLVCDASASATVPPELGVLTQIRGLPVRIAGLRRPILAPCGYVVRVVVLRFNLGRGRCKCHGLGTGVNDMQLERIREQHTFLM